MALWWRYWVFIWGHFIKAWSFRLHYLLSIRRTRNNQTITINFWIRFLPCTLQPLVTCLRSSNFNSYREPIGTTHNVVYFDEGPG
jgi:hypothetical protein